MATAGIAALVWLALLHNSVVGVVSQDPCLTNQRFVVETERDPSSATQDVPTCDLIVHQWYRVIGPGEIDLDITRQAPEWNHCATQSPMWMDGTLPAEGNETLVGICIVTVFGNCSARMSIGVKNCGQYRVYKLREPYACPSAYCFDVIRPTDAPPAVTCPNETLAIDGQPTVRPSVVDSDDLELRPGVPLKELQFQCNFSNAAPELLYDVKWFINNHQLAFKQTALPGHNLTAATLREQHWRGRFNMGMKVACSVAVRTRPTCNPGPEIRSDEYFAGIRVSPESLSLLETSPPQNLTYTLTVPIPCPETISICTVVLDASGRNSSLGCPIKPSSGNSVEALSCSLTFSSTDWQTPQTLGISATYNTDYDDHASLISLKATPIFTDFTQIWKDVIVPPVSVYVRDEDHAKRDTRCYAHNDPFYKTFDNRWLISGLEGEFVLFRHKTFPLAVHILQSRCNNNWGTSCICGVGVQSGQDVFMWAGCGDVYKIYKNFRIRSYGCFKSGMKLEEVVDGMKYRVHLPTGVKVEIKLMELGTNEAKYLDVDIYATPDTSGLVEGLCGNMDGNIHNDAVSDFSVFRVQQNNSLFNRSIRNDWSYNSVCTCRSDSNVNSRGSRFLACSNARTTSSCSIPGKDVTQVFAETCRQKRDLAMLDLDEEWPDFKLDENYVPPTPQWKNGWTSESATEQCWKYLQDMGIYKLCSGVANVNPDFSIYMCVYMIQETGSTSWSEVTFNAYKTQCQDEVSRNSSFWSTEPGQTSIFDSVMSLICPDNCNERGTCHRGVCTCNSGYTGADCALDVSKPPRDLVLPHLGMCDLKNGNPCEQSLVFGSQFIDLGTFGCKAELIQVTGSKIIRTGKVTRQSAVVHSRNEAKLVFDRIDSFGELADLNEPYVAGYKFTMTNNDVIYGEESIFLPYDSTCFSCSMTGDQASCRIKAGYCSINRRCVAGRETNPDNTCQVCDPVKSTSHWTSKDCEVSSSVHIITGSPNVDNTGKHVDGIQPYQPVGGPPPDKHVDGIPPEKHADGTLPEKHADGTPPEKHADGTLPQKHADGTPPEKHADGTPPEKHADGSPPEKHADRTPPENNADGTPPQNNADGTPPEKHVDGTPTENNADGAPPEENGDGQRPTDKTHTDTTNDEHVTAIATALAVGSVAFILAFIAISIVVYKKSPIYKQRVRIDDDPVPPCTPPPAYSRPLSAMSARSIAETFFGVISVSVPPTSTKLSEKQSDEEDIHPATVNQSS